MKALEKLSSSSDMLESFGIEDARREAELMLAYCMEIDRVSLYRDNPLLPESILRKIDEIMQRRKQREPLQYIFGHTDFHGLKIKVGHGILIPRPETELLVEAAIKIISDVKSGDLKFRFLDLCTGSGAIAIALAGAFPGSQVYGTDISDIAIQYARENAVINGIENVMFLQGSLFEPIRRLSTDCDLRVGFDLIAANPPYIKTSDIAGLQPEIREWEPVGALDGGEDGLDYYRAIIPEARNYLDEGGALFFEVGAGQADAVKIMAADAGYHNSLVIKDYSGIERILIAYMKREQKMEIQDENIRMEELDKKYIWHPFTQMKEWREETPVIISEGRDCFIKDIYGRWYLDGVSSIWVNIFGHRKKEIDEAIKAQIDRIAHSTMLGLSNVPAVRLAGKLIQLLDASFCPSSLKKVFYSDNGSTAVESGLKMAFQFWKHRGVDGRNAFVCLNNGYHGDTIGAVSVGGVDIFHEAFGPLLFKTYKAPSPYCYRCELGEKSGNCGLACLAEMDKLLYAHSGEIAGLIIEPIIQAAGGMITSPPGYLKGVRELCSKYDIIMIADEVATGFGRTGRMFACEHEQVVPDIMCLSKGITGGYMPLAVTLATDYIYNAFLGEFKDLKTFFHGHSYTGNPLACAAALACLELFEKESLLENMKEKIALLGRWLQEILVRPHVGDVRQAGLMAGVELVRDKKTKEPYDWADKMGWKVASQARDKGVFIRPLGNVIVIMPPLSISLQNLEKLLDVTAAGIMDATEERGLS